jgi:hypothetical protein
MEPRKPKDIERIIKRANYPSAAADLEEFDSLLSQETCFDPSLRPTPLQKREQTARERRLRVLSRRLFGESDKTTRRGC